MFGDMFLRRELHKSTTCIWIVLVIRGRIATRIRSSGLYLGPCNKERHAFGLTMIGVQPIFEFAHI